MMRLQRASLQARHSDGGTDMVGQNLVTATIDGTSTKVWLGDVSRNIGSDATAPAFLYHEDSTGYSIFL